MGLYRAGFDVTGIDIKPQPRYPAFHDAPHAKHFRFIQGDALKPPVRLEDFDLVWASPPCQASTPMSNRWRGRGGLADKRIDLIDETREILKGSGLPWVIENVIGSRLRRTLKLRGEMFGLSTSRPRIFETSFLILAPTATRRRGAVAIYGKADGRRLYSRKNGTELRAWTLEEGRNAMGMPWADEDGIRQAIPPAYAEHIGRYAIMALDARRDEGAHGNS